MCPAQGDELAELATEIESLPAEPMHRPVNEMFQLQGIDHIAIAVRDVERSVTWYLDVLGLERRHEDA